MLFSLVDRQYVSLSPLKFQLILQGPAQVSPFWKAPQAELVTCHQCFKQKNVHITLSPTHIFPSSSLWVLPVWTLSFMSSNPEPENKKVNTHCSQKALNSFNCTSDPLHLLCSLTLCNRLTQKGKNDLRHELNSLAGNSLPLWEQMFLCYKDYKASVWQVQAQH